MKIGKWKISRPGSATLEEVAETQAEFRAIADDPDTTAIGQCMQRLVERHSAEMVKQVLPQIVDKACGHVYWEDCRYFLVGTRFVFMVEPA
ncbi:hypothetical protein GTQ99_00540 [Kineococcus sp. T13]|uniref:hypothetical protein n=1 Tax=Kineococcus vitellinus TaxID=2696565 RepID=UPI001411DA9E|nr:hypothetical protein [Kineococcus vitellinus]NAZ73919.1 hypothetical protein [Kineococcus vitellinus]